MNIDLLDISSKWGSVMESEKCQKVLVSLCGLWDCTKSKRLYWLRDCLFWGFTSMILTQVLKYGIIMKQGGEALCSLLMKGATAGDTGVSLGLP